MTLFFLISDTHHNKHQYADLLTWVCYWAWHWPFQTSYNSEFVCEKHPRPQHSHQPLCCAGLIWYKCVTGVFIEQHRALLSPPFYTMSTFQPRRYWQPCSLTGKAIMSAHWQQIACCANRFLSPLAGARCSSLCSDTVHPFFNALLHSQDNLYQNVSVFVYSSTDGSPIASVRYLPASISTLAIVIPL